MMYEAYCPRCDRKFTSEKSNTDVLAKVLEHVKKHHDYAPVMYEDFDVKPEE